MIVPSVLAQTAPTVNGFNVSYGGRSYNAASDLTTFSYVVAGTNVSPDLSHFNVEIPSCDPALEVVSFNPSSAVTIGTDPTTGITGIKWDLPLRMDQTRTYSVSFSGDVDEGPARVAVKGGPGFEAISLSGPACTEAAIQLTKSVSVDGGATWLDAQIAPGSVAELGATVSFLLQVTNIGDFPLTNITLTDSMFTLGCEIPATLEVEDSFQCIVADVPVTEGQHVNTATVTATAVGGDDDDDDDDSGETVTDSDVAHYYGGSLPLINIEKLVSVGGVWYTADSAPGLIIPNDEQVSFRIVVTNDGTVSFTNLTLSDSQYALDGCAIPAELASGDSFECIIGPFDVESDDPQVNTATVTAQSGGETFTASDDAHYVSDDDDEGGTIIIIEGPVTEININIIIIYDIEIELNPDDPLLTVIRIGDIIRVEGDLVGEGDVIIVIAIIVIIIDVDIYVGDDDDVIWRDDGECGNPPPPWAPAHGWRRKCENNVIIIIERGGRGGGRGNDDDDDDD